MIVGVRWACSRWRPKIACSGSSSCPYLVLVISFSFLALRLSRHSSHPDGARARLESVWSGAQERPGRSLRFRPRISKRSRTRDGGSSTCGTSSWYSKSSGSSRSRRRRRRRSTNSRRSTSSSSSSSSNSSSLSLSSGRVFLRLGALHRQCRLFGTLLHDGGLHPVGWATHARASTSTLTGHRVSVLTERER